jgi:hypothetical protein
MDSTLQLLDLEISTMEVQLRLLKTRRNNLIPLFLLPNELLAQILVEVSTMVDRCLPEGKLSYDEHRRHNPKWTRIMLACTRLRSLALCTPELWTFLNCSGDSRKQPVELWAERASTFPLTLNAIQHGHQPKPTLTLVGTYLPRARSARIHGTTYGDVDANLQQLLMKSAPHLRFLGIVQADGFNLNSSFLGGANALTTFHMHGGLLDDDIPSFPSLQNLRLSGVRVQEGISSIGYILSSAPRLRSICVAELRDEDMRMLSLQDVICHEWDQVYLPNLETLQLSVTPSVAYAIISMVPNPTRSLGIDLSSFDGRPEHTLLQTPAVLTYIADRAVEYWSACGQGRKIDVAILSFSGTYSSQFILRPSESRLDHPELRLHMDGTIGSTHPLLKLIHTVHIQRASGETSVHALYNTFLAIDQLQMPSLQLVLMKQVWNMNLQTVESWLRRRLEAGRPIKSMDFDRCDADNKKFARSLGDNGLVEVRHVS